MLTKLESNELFDAITIAKKNCKDIYAQTYLSALDEASIMYGSEGLKTQILYALNNMSTWRGQTARDTKKILNRLIKKL